ncbi:MAG: PQQ-binding-like beta-propeller repeat protein [Bacteroidales bacterium]|nr:PQQ-binding-like beta-propeller repeat protein [Bacteroidales bacterium]MBR4689782.1 PQQ-binding-like beta-propeller repeat protein [Bacteroidales bacterium]
MKRFLFLICPILFVACASHEGMVTTTYKDSCKITTVQLKGAAYSTPIRMKNNTVVLGTHRRSIYFLTSNDSLSSGNMIKKVYRTKFWVHATPAIVYDSLVSIGSYDGNMYFFNEDGELQKTIRPGGRIYTNSVQLDSLWMVFATGVKGLWFYNMNADTLFLSRIKHLTHGSPTVLGNALICIGSNDKRMYFFDNLGNLLSTFQTDGWIMHSKAMPQSDSVIVFGSYDKNIYSVSTTGKMQWRFDTEGRIHASPQQFANGNIICGSFDKNIYVVDHNGLKIAEIPTGKRVVSSAGIINNGEYAVVGSYDKYLYVIRSNGELVKKIFIGGKIFSSPIILDDGTIFCATTNGKAVFVEY